MTVRTIAGLIPANYRKEILETNMITNAVATAADGSMFYLFTIWKDYVEPSADLSLECGLCLERILKNYRGMLDTLLQLEKEARLLKNL